MQAIRVRDRSAMLAIWLGALALPTFVPTASANHLVCLENNVDELEVDRSPLFLATTVVAQAHVFLTCQKIADGHFRLTAGAEVGVNNALLVGGVSPLSYEWEIHCWVDDGDDPVDIHRITTGDHSIFTNCGTKTVDCFPVAGGGACFLNAHASANIRQLQLGAVDEAAASAFGAVLTT